MPLPVGKDPPARIQIHDVRPQVDGGRYAAKACAGDRVEFSARIFRDGHDVLGAAVRLRGPQARRWQEVPLVPQGNDWWTATVPVEAAGRWRFQVAAWVDRFASWRQELSRKVAAGQDDLSGELAEGAQLLGAASLTAEQGLAGDQQDRSEFTTSPTLELDLDRVRARFGAWYELFPRSWGGFAGVERALPELAELGFDVLYLPPIHPIGRTNRKGRNNALAAGAEDVGSPWAIGGKEGGHTAIDPELGTLADFDRLVERAAEHRIEIALDLAIQCSPDHHWLRDHPDWFHRRPDGTLKYAENPPKRYQDIYNVNFASPDWRALWEELLGIVRHWVGHGVKIFRVDNPHTKPVPFWEWLIAEVRREDPDVIFLAEAFTRPAMMQTLGKIGFGQSYTYFTWKNTRAELTEFLLETLAWAPYYRPNFFANTPDILHEYLQRGGPPAFEARLVLAATLSPAYGIYSGYEWLESAAVGEGSEEYLDSEKYEARARALDGAPLLPLIRRLNEVRRASPALQRFDNLSLLETESEHLFAYAKRVDDDDIFCIVNLDPGARREGLAIVPARMGLPPVFRVRDLLTGADHTWHTGRNYAALDPGQAHVMRVVR